MNINFRLYKVITASDERFVAAIINRPSVDNNYFLVTNDGTAQFCGGYPQGIAFTPDVSHLCSWNLGSFDDFDNVEDEWNEGGSIDLPSVLDGSSITFVSDGISDDGTLNLTTLIGEPATVAHGLDDVLSGIVSGSEMLDSDAMICDHYTTNVMYSGQHEYHYHHGRTQNAPTESYSGHRIGVELEVIALSPSKQEKINRKSSNWFYQERDGSLDDYGVEIITIPLLPSDAKSEAFWQPLCDFLNPLAESWNRNCCGLHVHIGREILGDTGESRSETLGKLLYFYHHCIGDDNDAMAVNARVYGRQHTYNEHSCKTEEGNAVKLLGKGVLKDKGACAKLKDGMIRAASNTRYFDINIENTATVEFRKGKGSICAERISAIVAWSEQMIEYCKRTNWEDLDFNSFIKYIRGKESDVPESLLGILINDR